MPPKRLIGAQSAAVQLQAFTEIRAIDGHPGWVLVKDVEDVAKVGLTGVISRTLAMTTKLYGAPPTTEGRGASRIILAEHVPKYLLHVSRTPRDVMTSHALGLKEFLMALIPCTAEKAQTLIENQLSVFKPDEHHENARKKRPRSNAADDLDNVAVADPAAPDANASSSVAAPTVVNKKARPRVDMTKGPQGTTTKEPNMSTAVPAAMLTAMPTAVHPVIETMHALLVQHFGSHSLPIEVTLAGMQLFAEYPTNVFKEELAEKAVADNVNGADKSDVDVSGKTVSNAVPELVNVVEMEPSTMELLKSPTSMSADEKALHGIQDLTIKECPLDALGSGHTMGSSSTSPSPLVDGVLESKVGSGIETSSGKTAPLSENPASKAAKFSKLAAGFTEVLDVSMPTLTPEDLLQKIYNTFEPNRYHLLGELYDQAMAQCVQHGLASTDISFITVHKWFVENRKYRV